MQKRLCILFIHQNFPGQFKYLAPALAQAGHEVTALAIQKNDRQQLAGVHVRHYRLRRSSTRGIHPWIEDFESKIIRAEACFHTCLQLRESGLQPDIVIAHPGWGESLFVHEVWPKTRIGLYAEWYYLAHADADFDPEFPLPNKNTHACRLHLRNLPLQMQEGQAAGFLCPTKWQAASFPPSVRNRTHVVHDGIDTGILRPDPVAKLQVKAHCFTRQDEVITFVSRHLEPYRGFHSFMRALPALLEERPRAQVLIIGEDGRGYGAPPPTGESWKDIFINEVRPRISSSCWQRVHFLGRLPYPDFIRALQISSVHIYLSYPFVLSWSLLEAMSTECAIVASATPAVQEVMQDGRNGLLVDFFSPQQITQAVCQLLEQPLLRRQLGAEARQDVRQHYDVHSVCLPRQLQWVASLR